MSLPNNVISDFCEVVITEDAKPAGSTSYGYAKVVGGQTYVQLDGSDILTPTSTTVTVADGERVLVTIKNHEAVVTGNISNQAASSSSVTTIAGEVADIETNYVKTSKLEADYISATQIKAEYATIESLNASEVAAKKLYATQATVETLQGDYATFKSTTTTKLAATDADITNLKADKIDASAVEANYAKIAQLDTISANVSDLQAKKADISTLKSDYATITSLNATNAKIETLESKKIDADSVEANYAKINFSNIEEAAVKKLFADTGLIKDLVIQNGTVSSGVLQAVTILGDMITAGTIKADRLIFKGEDGVYYQLNHQGSDGVSTTQTNENSLNGSYIQAKSIAADKIAVSDLSAFNATLGNFIIDSDAIRTTGASGVTDLVQGLYFSSNGEIYVGAGDDAYLRLYQDEVVDQETKKTSKVWKFELVVGGLSFAALGQTAIAAKSVADATQTAIGNLVPKEEYNADQEAVKNDISSIQSNVETKLDTDAFNTAMGEMADSSGGLMTYSYGADGMTFGFSYDEILSLVEGTYALPKNKALSYIHLGTFTDSDGTKRACLYLCDLDQSVNEASGNSFATLLTTNGLEFHRGPDRLSYFSNQTMYILNALIEQSLTVGVSSSDEDAIGFSFRSRDVSGIQHMGLRYE